MFVYLNETGEDTDEVRRILIRSVGFVKERIDIVILDIVTATSR